LKDSALLFLLLFLCSLKMSKSAVSYKPKYSYSYECNFSTTTRSQGTVLKSFRLQEYQKVMKALTPCHLYENDAYVIFFGKYQGDVRIDMFGSLAFPQSPQSISFGVWVPVRRPGAREGSKLSTLVSRLGQSRRPLKHKPPSRNHRILAFFCRTEQQQ
jgi:hypothetical protein